MSVIVVTVLAALMILAELVLRARSWPRVTGWWTRALLLNGAQFASPEGVVTVEVGRPAGPAPAEAEEVIDPVCLTVCDTGPGIKMEEVGRIFDPFFTTRQGGSGLGLAVVHRAVEVHDGAVLAENGPEGGARFVIYLPSG